VNAETAGRARADRAAVNRRRWEYLSPPGSQLVLGVLSEKSLGLVTVCLSHKGVSREQSEGQAQNEQRQATEFTSDHWPAVRNWKIAIL